MSYVLRKVHELGYAGVDYLRVSPLGTAGLIQEILLGTTAVQLASSADQSQPTGLHLPNAFERRIFGPDRSYTESFGEETTSPDLEGLVASSITVWADLLKDDAPLRVVTDLAEQRAPAEYHSQSGLIVLSPELATNNDAGEFLGYVAQPDEIDAISRVGAHLAGLITRNEEPLPGNYI